MHKQALTWLSLTWMLGTACTKTTVVPPDGLPDALAQAMDAQTSADQGVCGNITGDRERGGVCLHGVEGQLVDEQGVPIADTTVTVCAGGCFFGHSGPDGRFTVAVEQYLQVKLYSLLIHAQPRRTAYYLALPPLYAGHATFVVPLPVPAMPQDGPTLKDDKSAQTLIAGGVTLTVDAGTDVFFSFEDELLPTLGHKLRPLRLSPSQVPFLGDVKPALLYGFGPFEALLGKPARLAFDLSADDIHAGLLPAGSSVEVLGQRGLSRGPPPGAALDRVALGHVSADGKRIDLDAGAGITTLTWIAVRKLEN